jgi:hypothetical protein
MLWCNDTGRYKLPVIPPAPIITLVMPGIEQVFLLMHLIFFKYIVDFVPRTIKLLLNGHEAYPLSDHLYLSCTEQESGMYGMLFTFLFFHWLVPGIQLLSLYYPRWSRQ